MDTRTTIINTVAARQGIYDAKRAEAFERDNDERFDRMCTAVEVCDYVLYDILTALGLPVADETPDELIELISTFPEHA